MNYTLLIILAVFINICVIVFLLYKTNEKFEKIQQNGALNGLSLDTKTRDMDLLYSSLNTCFLKNLRDFSVRDFNFSESSPIKVLYSGKYRDLIQYLLRPDIKLKHTEGDVEVENSFFEYFIQRIYFMYIAETPEYIKNLLYRYYSGYTTDTYFVKKKEKPNCIAFITEYVRNKLWLRYNECENESQGLLDSIRTSSPDNGLSMDYAQIMDDYDKFKLSKINLNIYHMTDSSAEKAIIQNRVEHANPKTTDSAQPVKENVFTENMRVEQKGESK